LTTKYEFARVLEARAASIVQLNLGRAGGLLEGKKIAGLAEAFGAQIAPHCYNGPIGLAANVQLATCSPNFLIIESIMDNLGFHAELLTSPIEWVDGRIVPSTSPGLGVDLNEDVARAHPYAGDRTHRTMWNDPIDTADDVVR
jgi:L-alanine-DL-glutamate epimerase-like enolase superfamily enzyme